MSKRPKCHNKQSFLKDDFLVNTKISPQNLFRFCGHPKDHSTQQHMTSTSERHLVLGTISIPTRHLFIETSRSNSPGRNILCHIPKRYPDRQHTVYSERSFSGPPIYLQGKLNGLVNHT